MIQTTKLDAVLFLHSHYQTGELIQTSILELSGERIPISAIEYLGSGGCVKNEDFDGFALDEPIAVSLTMERKEDDLFGGWYIASMEQIKPPQEPVLQEPDDLEFEDRWMHPDIPEV